MYQIQIETSLRDTLEFSEIISDTPEINAQLKREASNLWTATVADREEAEELQDEIDQMTDGQLEVWVDIQRV